MTLFKCSTLTLVLLFLATLGFTSGLKCHHCIKYVGGEDDCKENFGGEPRELPYHKDGIVCYREETTSPEGKSLLLGAQKIGEMKAKGHDLGCHNEKPNMLLCYCDTDGCNPAIKLGVNISVLGMAFLSAFSNFLIGDRIGLIM